MCVAVCLLAIPRPLAAQTSGGPPPDPAARGAGQNPARTGNGAARSGNNAAKPGSASTSRGRTGKPSTGKSSTGKSSTGKSSPGKSTTGITADVSGPIGVFTSRQIELHTDLDREAAEELIERLESELVLIGKYWGRAASGVFEMYVVADLAKWPRGMLAGEGLAHVESGGGVTVGQTRTDGTNFVAKARVYAVADRGTPQHELVHAYCVQTFGRVGPVWYAEGMAEMGQYWRGDDRAVLASPPVIRYLRESPLVPVDEIVHGEQKSGDSWKNYAWRWALCHLLANNPNYSPRFRPLGVALLTGQRTGFDNVYGSLLPEIEFEYREFLKQLDSGLRVDLTAWNWQAKFKAPSARSNTKARVEAGRGWQPSRLTLRAGDQLTYACTGEWKLGQGGDPVSADGGPAGRGKLLGVLLLDEGDRYQLGEPFELGSTGQFTAPTAGRLYLRCQDRWTELANNSGFVTVELQLAQEAEEGAGLKESPPGKTPPTKSPSGKTTPGEAPPAPAS
ncbi:MAG: hypothetical protein ACKOFW_07075, partial [Planctomycetaceae bacterium]